VTINEKTTTVFVGRSIFKFCINFLRYRTVRHTNCSNRGSLHVSLCALFSYNWLKVRDSQTGRKIHGFYISVFHQIFTTCCASRNLELFYLARFHILFRHSRTLQLLCDYVIKDVSEEVKFRVSVCQSFGKVYTRCDRSTIFTYLVNYVRDIGYR